MREEENAVERNASFATGTAPAGITDVRILDKQGETLNLSLSRLPGHSSSARGIQTAVEVPVVGILVRNRLGIDVYGDNTRTRTARSVHFHAGEVLEVDFNFDCLLTRQEYTLTGAATQYWDGRARIGSTTSWPSASSISGYMAGFAT
jgi:lipopolysaccharide transport system ATP-binding protein